MRYVKGTPMYGVGHGGLRDLNVRGLSLSKPPYGRLSAIDLNRGESSGRRRTATRLIGFSVIRRLRASMFRGPASPVPGSSDRS